MTPNFSTFTFEGDVSIELTVNKEALVGDLKKQITLHSKELCYISAYFKVADKEDAAAVTADEFRVTRIPRKSLTSPSSFKRNDCFISVMIEVTMKC